MKKLSIVCMVMLVILAAGRAFALPGVYRAGSSTMALPIGRCETRTISLDGTGFISPFVSGGFLLAQSDGGAAVNIPDCQCYDIWDSPPSIVFDPTGYPGGLFVIVTNLGAGVTPSDNILVCDVTFCGVSWGTATITIDTVPDFDT